MKGVKNTTLPLPAICKRGKNWNIDKKEDKADEGGKEYDTASASARNLQMRMIRRRIRKGKNGVKNTTLPLPAICKRGKNWNVGRLCEIISQGK